MPCDTYRQPNQTLTQRKEQIKDIVDNIARALVRGDVKAVVSKQGAVTFTGITIDRAGVTDGCVFRRIMATGSQSAKLAIMRAEQLAGVTVNRQTVAQGVHSHDGGATWSSHKHHH